jgi:broad specificity phosphatase PhoE
MYETSCIGQSTENLAQINKEQYDYKEPIVLTDQGKLQAVETGKYLQLFGKFDKIISSPITRCVETANLIKEHIQLKDTNIIFSKSLIEPGETNDLKKMKPEEKTDIVKSFRDKMLEIEKEPNLFLKRQLYLDFDLYVGKEYHFKPTLKKQIKSCTKFLKKIKNYLICIKK